MIKDIPQSIIDAVKKVLNESIEHPMIEVDGVMKHRHNSLGQPIHPTDEGIKNFHRWFGDDENLDEHGRPKVLYHSSLQDIEQFSPTGKFMGYSGTTGISLTDSPQIATRYLDRYSESGWVNGLPNQPFHKQVIPVYAKLGKTLHRNERFPTQNGISFGSPIPKDYIPIHKLMGYDTLVIDDSISRNGSVKHSTAKNALRGKEYILTSPNQIKSAIGNNGNFSHPTKITESEEDYRGSHTSPNAEFGAPAHDLTKIYPQDFYSSRGSQYYGDGRPEDKRIHTLLSSFKNKPDADVMIYRAVPNESSIKEINPGDWVTPNLHYAVEHGNRFDSSKILSKMVKASEIYTDGNSFHEFGYHPNK